LRKQVAAQSIKKLTSLYGIQKYTILVGNIEGNGPLRRTRSRREGTSYINIDRLCGPPSLLSEKYGVKRPGRDADH
jgi:hypothetical protein